MNGKNYIYFDNAATTPLSPVAKEILICNEPWTWANASSLYEIGKQAKEKLKEARTIVAKCINAEPHEIYFTSSGTEGNNWIIRGIASRCTCTSISTVMEHPAGYNTLNSLGSETCLCGIDENGFVNYDDIFNCFIEHNTHCFASIMMVNNELGSVQQIADIQKLLKKRKVFIHTDAVQAVGHIPVDVKELGVDYLVASGHKFNGPKGVGFVYISQNAEIKPIPLLIGGNQENKQRASTENIVGIYSMAKALQDCLEKSKWASQKIDILKRELVKKLSSLGGKNTILINGNPLHPNNSGIGIVNFSIPNINSDGEAVQILLNGKIGDFDVPVYVSTGSACSSGSSSPSRVLMALPGMSHERAVRSIRVSLSSNNTINEIDYFIKKLKIIIELLGER